MKQLALGLNLSTKKMRKRKILIVEGTLHRPASSLGGCGHFSLWPAEIVARTLERAPTAS